MREFNLLTPFFGFAGSTDLTVKIKGFHLGGWFLGNGRQNVRREIRERMGMELTRLVRAETVQEEEVWAGD